MLSRADIYTQFEDDTSGNIQPVKVMVEDVIAVAVPNMQTGRPQSCIGSAHAAVMCYQCVIKLARQRGRSECDKLDHRRSAKLTVPPSSDARPLIYRSDRQALSTTRFLPAGLLATADDTVDQ